MERKRAGALSDNIQESFNAAKRRRKGSKSEEKVKRRANPQQGQKFTRIS
jgi:hypothetical protein